MSLELLQPRNRITTIMDLIFENENIITLGVNISVEGIHISSTEFTAQSLIGSAILGDSVSIGQKEIDDLVNKSLN